MSAGAAHAADQPPRAIGVRIAGTGSAVPSRVITNKDLEKVMDTSDDWIVQRTGVRERRFCDREKGETNRVLCAQALRRALEAARMDASELDLIVVGTCTGESTVPAVACRVAAEVGATGAGAFDVVAACSGFVYSINIAHQMVRSGASRAVGVIGCDTLSSIIDIRNRSVGILFGDGAGAAVLRATDDPAKGLLAHSLHADGSGWQELHLPHTEADLPEGQSFGDEPDSIKPHCLHMNGRTVYKFAVNTFCELIRETLDKAGVQAADVAQFVCHQSNMRILESARERFGIPPEKLHINIDRFGNTSAGSVPIVLDELARAGKLKDGDLILMVAFGAGLTWASGLWRI